MSGQTIETQVCGYRMEIELDSWKAHRGARERGTGLQLEPDEEAGFEVAAIKLLDPADIMEIITEEVTISMDEVKEAVTKYFQE